MKLPKFTKDGKELVLYDDIGVTKVRNEAVYIANIIRDDGIPAPYLEGSIDKPEGFEFDENEALILTKEQCQALIKIAKGEATYADYEEKEESQEDLLCAWIRGDGEFEVNWYGTWKSKKSYRDHIHQGTPMDLSLKLRRKQKPMVGDMEATHIFVAANVQDIKGGDMIAVTEEKEYLCYFDNTFEKLLFINDSNCEHYLKTGSLLTINLIKSIKPI